MKTREQNIYHAVVYGKVYTGTYSEIAEQSNYSETYLRSANTKNAKNMRIELVKETRYLYNVYKSKDKEELIYDHVESKKLAMLLNTKQCTISNYVGKYNKSLGVYIERCL